MERRRERREHGARSGCVRPRLAGHRPNRPRGLLRLPGEPPHDQAGRRAHAAGRLARQHVGLGADHRSRTRPRPAQRGRAEPALAHLFLGDPRRRRAAGRGDAGLARRPDRRRGPQPPRPDHRAGHRRGPRRAPQPEPLELRGPDRDRRRPPRPVPRARHLVGEPLGGDPALRRRGPEPEGRSRAAPPAGGHHRDRAGGIRAGGRHGALRGPDRPRRGGQPGDPGARPATGVAAGGRARAAPGRPFR